jgi:D-alanyl-D-alanine endopeptidase (penicillin-binding protein 7)
VQLVVRAIATSFVLGLAAVCAHVATPSVDASTAAVAPAPVARREATGWLRPDWFPDTPDIEAIPAMDARGPTEGPPVRSRAAFVYDLDAGVTLFEKNADVVRPVASLTKLVSALALTSTGASLDNGFCVGAAQYPTRSGATSRLSTGDCLTGWDSLGAALVASDNRGAYGLAAVAGLDVDEFVGRMNDVSEQLGMASSTWSDPSGLEDENLSTARDIARATVAVAAHPVLSMVATAPFWDLHRENRESARRLFSTARIVGREDIELLAAKTGYTDTARYCFSTVVRTDDGRRVVISLLGGEGKLTRWADVDRILSWLD